MSEFLIGTVSPWLVTGCLLTVFIIALLQLPLLVRWAWRHPWTTLALLLITVAGVAIRAWWVPNTMRIYFDEDRYLAYAVAFGRFGKTLNIDLATPDRLIITDVDTVARVTVPTINGWTLRLTGFKEPPLYWAAKAFACLQIPLIFIGMLLLFESQFAALVAAFLMAFLPSPVFWSTSTALDSYFVTFAILAFVGATWYGRETKFISALFLICATLILLFVRFESFLFLFVTAATILVIRLQEKNSLFTGKDLRYIFLALPIIGVRALVSLSVFGQPWCCGEATPLEAFQAGYFVRNTIPNLLSLFNRPEIPWLMTILALVAVFRASDRRIFIPVFWFMLYFFIYSFYFAGTFFIQTYSGSYGRYALMTIPPLAILCALSLDQLRLWFGKTTSAGRVMTVALGSLALLTLYPTVSQYRTMIRISPYDPLVDNGPRSMREFLLNVIIPNTPQNAIIIHSLTGSIVMSGRTAVYFGYFLNDDKTIQFVMDALKNGTPVYILQVHTCDLYPDKCAKITPLVKFVNIPVTNAPYPGFEMAQVKLKD